MAVNALSEILPKSRRESRGPSLGTERVGPASWRLRRWDTRVVGFVRLRRAIVPMMVWISVHRVFPRREA